MCLRHSLKCDRRRKMAKEKGSKTEQAGGGKEGNEGEGEGGKELRKQGLHKLISRLVGLTVH